MTDFYGWSSTASDNDDADTTINWAENQDPSTVNNSARAMMKRLADWRKDVGAMRSSTGSGNAYTVTSSAGGSSSYRDGEIVTFIADRANTGACTINVNSKGARAFRPAQSVEFQAGEIKAGQAIVALYTSGTNEFLSVGSGYHVNAMTEGLLTQSVVGRLIKIGTPVLSIKSTPETGYIRLTESTQAVTKADYPELDSWLSAQSYPWGSTATTFNLPPAAGYVLRFAGTTSGVDPDGPRTAGSTQTDANAAHTHSFSDSFDGTTSSDGAHTHTVQGATNAGAGGGGAGGLATDSTRTTSSAGAHTHTFSGSVSGTTGSTGGTEARPKNVAMHVDVFASSALSAGTLGMFGFPYGWDTGTSAANPGTGRVRGNNGTLASITALYINETDQWGVDLSSTLGGINTNSLIRLSKIGAQANVIVARVTGSVSDNGTYRTIPVTVLTSNGSLSANDSMAFEIFLSGASGVGIEAATWKAAKLLDGEEGIALDFTAQAYAINDYTDTLTEAGRIDDLLTVTRASSATYVGRDRVLKTASNNVLRYDHNPTTGEPLGLSSEASSTNYFTYSEEFNNAAWTKSAASISANADTAPDGTTTADKLVESTATGLHVMISQTKTVADATVVHSTSFWAKAAGRDYFRLQMDPGSGAAGFTADFNLANGTASSSDVATSGSSASIEQWPNGWYRCTAIGSPATSGTSIRCVLYLSSNATPTFSYTGDGSSGLHLWGAQLEAQPAATSYIKTTTSSATRAADSVTLATSAFPWDLNNFTWFVEAAWLQSASSRTTRAICLEGSTTYTTDGTALTLSTTGGVLPQLKTGGAAVVNMAGGTTTSGAVFKAALSYRPNDAKGDTSLVSGLTDTSCAIPAVAMTTLTIGSSSSSSETLNGYIRRILVVTRAMTAAEIDTLTS